MDNYPLVFVRVVYESLDAAAFNDVHGDILVELGNSVSRTNWACGRDKTHCQKLDDPFNPLGEDNSPVLSVAGIVAADVVVRRATCMSAEGDVLI